MRLKIGYPSAASEKEILRDFANSDPMANLQPVMTGAEVAEIQASVRQVTVDDELVNYTLAIVEKTRHHEFLSLGVSPRGSMSLYRAAQARAYLEGRNYCIPDDFKRLVLPVFAHRCVVSSRYLSTLKKIRPERGRFGGYRRVHAGAVVEGQFTVESRNSTVASRQSKPRRQPALNVT